MLNGITGKVTAEKVEERMNEISSGKLYRGKRLKYSQREVRVEGAGKLSRLLMLPKIRPGSITWESSGDATDISLGILLDFFNEAPEDEDLRVGKTEAQKHFIGFRSAFLRPLRVYDEWTIPEVDIRSWIRVYAAEALFGSGIVVTDALFGSEGEEGGDDDLREDD